MRLDDTKVPKGRPAPRMANGKPDFSGYWKGTTQTSPGGNIGKDSCRDGSSRSRPRAKRRSSTT